MSEQNLIVNGNFGNGLDGWNPTGAVSSYDNSQAARFDGRFPTTPGGHDGALQQTMQTVAGQTYTVTFELKSNYHDSVKLSYDTEQLALSVTLLDGSTAIVTRTISADLMSTSHTISFTFVATGPQTTLRFAETSNTHSTNGANMVLDNVSVVAGESVSADALNTVQAGQEGGFFAGSSGDDQFLGGEGNDTFQGSGGDDMFVGGGGDYNQVNLAGSRADWTFSVRPDHVIVGTNQAGEQVLMRDIQGVYFSGDESWHDAIALPTTFVGLGGNNRIAYTLTADADGGHLSGSHLRDVFEGGAGDDTFYGRSGGGDIYSGGGGSDQIHLDGTAADYTFTRTDDGILIERAGWQSSRAIDIDSVYFLGEQQWADINALAVDGDGRHVFDATADGGFIFGTDQADRFNGGDGNDTFAGGKGDDLYFGGGGSYNQVDLDGRLEEWSFVRQDDGSVVATHAEYGSDVLHDIDGIWFAEAEQWRSVDDLTM